MTPAAEILEDVEDEDGQHPSPPSPAPLPRWALALTLFLGIAAAGLGLLLLRGPSPTLARAIQSWRYGASLSAQGVALTLGPAPALPGQEPSPARLQVTFYNAGRSPQVVQLLRPYFDSLLWDVLPEGAAETLAPGDFLAPSLAQTPQALVLAPGQKVGFVVDLRQRFELAPGRYTVSAEFLSLGDMSGLSRCQSNEWQLELPERESR